MPTYERQDVDWFVMRQCRDRARRELLAAGFNPLSKKLPEAIARRARRYYGEAR